MSPGGGLFSAPRHQGSIVSATTFHFRVRDENGWVRRALTTRTTIIATCGAGSNPPHPGGSSVGVFSRATRATSRTPKPRATASPHPRSRFQRVRETHLPPARQASIIGPVARTPVTMSRHTIRPRRTLNAAPPACHSSPQPQGERPPLLAVQRHLGQAGPSSASIDDTGSRTGRQQSSPSRRAQSDAGTRHNKGRTILVRPLDLVGSGRGIRTLDLRVMSPTSYRCSIPRRLPVPSIHSTYLQRLASPWARGRCTEYYATPLRVLTRSDGCSCLEHWTALRRIDHAMTIA